MMRLRTLTAAALIAAGMSVDLSAQKAVRFSSVYSDLTHHCREIPGENGSDGASICRGPAGYQVQLSYSASTTELSAEKRGSDAYVGLASLNYWYDSSKTTFEWRLANGKPFAVIMRVPLYGDPKEGDYFGKVVGYELKVTGLPGFDINEHITATLPGANKKAREIADKAYPLK
jgi:hypothetical protein